MGDDDDDAANTRACQGLARLAASGVEVYALHGNRDFLLGKGFERRTGVKLLPDPVSLDLYGVATLLSHGDVFCTDDLPYQELRSIVRQPGWQRRFLALPLATRRELASAARAGSKAHTERQVPVLMDVNADAVVRAMQATGTHRVIHGHTHRPAVHEFMVDGQRAQRVVLARGTNPRAAWRSPPREARSSPAAVISRHQTRVLILPMTDSTLPRVIGVSGVAFTAFNCVVGVGIFGLPGLVAAVLGPAAILAYVVCLLLFGLIALCLAEAGSRVSSAGGLYAYASTAFGPVVGGVAGMLMLFASSSQRSGYHAVLHGYARRRVAVARQPHLEFPDSGAALRRYRRRQHRGNTRWQPAHHHHRAGEVRAARAAGHCRRLSCRRRKSLVGRTAGGGQDRRRHSDPVLRIRRHRIRAQHLRRNA